MKNYTSPEMNVNVFETEDVVTVSGLILTTTAPSENTAMVVDYEDLWA